MQAAALHQTAVKIFAVKSTVSMGTQKDTAAYFSTQSLRRSTTRPPRLLAVLSSAVGSLRGESRCAAVRRRTPVSFPKATGVSSLCANGGAG